MGIKLWADIPHCICSHWPENTVWPRCPVLSSPAHPTTHQLAATQEPSGATITFPGLCQASSWRPATPWIYTLIHDSTHSPAWGTRGCRGVGSHHAHRTGCVYRHSKPCRWGLPSTSLQSGELKELPISQRKSCSAVEWLASSWSRGHPWAASLTGEKATEIWACQERKNHIHSVGTEQKVHSKTFRSTIIQSILSWATVHGMTTVSQRRQCFVAY